MSYPPRPYAPKPYTQERKPYLPSGPITKADIARCDPPPNWTAEKQEAHERAWARGHKSSPTQAESQQAQAARLRDEASRMTTAEEWRQIFKRGEVM